MLGAVELGGTWVRAAVGEPGHLAEVRRWPTTTPQAVFAALTDFFATHGPVDRVGVGSFGPLRLDGRAPDAGHLLATPKPGWSGVDLAARISAAAQAPVVLETDVGAALLGEVRHGAAQGCAHAIYLTVGTGVGAAVWADNTLLHGVLHPEAGHMRAPRLPGDRFPGVCPFHGDCVEGVASGPALRARTGRAGETLEPDHPAWAPTVHAIAHLVVNLVYTAAPERLVLGGGVGAASGVLARTQATAEALDGGYRGVDWARMLVAPGCGPEAALLGALCLGSPEL